MTGDDAGVGDGGDFARQLTRKVEELVGVLRDHSVRPVLSVAAVVVVALAGVVLAIAVLTIAGVGIITLFNHDVFGGRVWATDFTFGGILGLAGLFLLRRSVKTRRGDVRS